MKLFMLIAIICHTSIGLLHGKEMSLYQAIDSENTEVVRKLIQNGADVNKRFVEDQYPALFYAASWSNIEIIKLLIDAGADIHAKTKWGTTAFHAAASNGKQDVAKLLLEKGAVFDEKDDTGRTPLYNAAYSAEEETAIWLLDLGADPDIKPKPSLGTPIFYAAHKGRVKLVEKLIEKEADLEAVGEEGQTALHAAAVIGNKEIVHLLLKAGANVNAVDKRGKTPLHSVLSTTSLLFFGERATIVDMLISSGANPFKEDNYGRTPLYTAERTYKASLNEKIADDVAKQRIQKETKAALKRIEYHTKQANKVKRKQQGFSFFKKKASADTQEEANATSVDVSPEKTDTSGSESPVPLQVVGWIVGILVIVGAGIFLVRKK